MPMRLDEPYHLELLGFERRSVPVTAVPTSPVAGYHAWYDAQTSVTFDGSNNVTQWNDQSANALHLTPNANPFTYNATGLAGKPCLVSADAAAVRTLTSPAFTAYTGTTYTAFAAVSFTTLAFPRRCVSISKDTATADHTSVASSVIIYTNSGTQAGGYRNGAKSLATVSANTRYILTSIFDGTSHTTRINTVAATPVASTGAFNVGVYRVGNSTAPADAVVGNQFVGKIGELILYQGTLSAQQITDNETYMTNRW